MAYRTQGGQFDSEPTGPNRLSKVVVAVGFVGFLAAVAVAHGSPADGYEVSIYRATPIGVWIGFGVAYLAAAVSAMTASDRRIGGLGLLVGGLTTVGIIALPALRGYRYYGQKDALTHLGWVRDMAAGRMGFFDLFYPGPHTSTVLLSDASGLPDTHVVLFLVSYFVGVYLLFVSLTVRALVGRFRATAIAAFSGFFLLSITHISGGPTFHTFSLATFFVPLVVFLFVKHLTGALEDDRLPSVLSPGNAALVFAGTALVLFHPQTTLNVVILFVTIAIAQAVYRGLWPEKSVSGLRAIYGVAIFLAILWVVWVQQFGQAFTVGERVIMAIQQLIAGEAGAAGGTVGTQGQSIVAVGGSLFEIFLKLFLVSAVYCLFAGGLFVAAVVSDRLKPTLRAVMLCFGIGGLVLIPFFAAHFVGDISHLFFRHVNFTMAIVTIFGAIGIYYAIGAIEPRIPRGIGRPAAIGLLSVALVLSVLVAFPSPYLFNQSHHVSDYQMEGYATAFEHQDESIQFTGIRSGPGRYSDALRAEDNSVTAPGVTEEEILQNPSTTRENDLYFPVTAVDRDREVTAYRELRYSDSSFGAIDEKPDVHRVQSNGEFTLYYIEGNAAGDSDPEEG